jgi:hypothetical protein
MAGLYQCGSSSRASCARGTCPSLGGVGLAPFPWGQASEPVRPDRDTHQPQGWETDSRSHTPHLAVAALGEGEFDPGGRDVPAHADGRIARPQFWFRNKPNFRRAGTAIVESHTVAQFFQCLCTRYTFHLCPVGLGQLVFRFGNAGLQASIVSEQQQTFTVVVEPTGGPHTRN